MAIFRHVYTKFWEDSLVIEKMNESDKLFFLYLLTNRNTTQMGIYAITVRQISFELGYSSEMVKELIAKFENELELIIYDEKTSEVAIKNWGKYNLNKGGKPIVDCITKELKDVKNKELIKIVSEKIEKDDIKNIFNLFYDDSFTIRGEKENKKEKKKENKKEKEKENKRGEINNDYKFGKHDIRKNESRTKVKDDDKIRAIEQYLKNR